MNVYTYSQARRHLAAVLDEAKREGEVRITRRDGTAFALRPVEKKASALDVPAVEGVEVTSEEIAEMIREGRDRTHGGT